MDEIHLEVNNNIREVNEQQKLPHLPRSLTLFCIPYLMVGRGNKCGVPLYVALSPLLSAFDTITSCAYVLRTHEPAWSKAAKLACVAGVIVGAVGATYQMLGPSIVDFAIAEGMGKSTGESIRTVATVLAGCYSAGISSAVMKYLSFRAVKKNHNLNEYLLAVVPAPEYSPNNPAEHSPRVVHLGM